MSRFPLMTYCKVANFFLKELMLKCTSIILLGEFSYIAFSPTLTSLNSSEAENNGDFQDGFCMNIILVSFYTIENQLKFLLNYVRASPISG